MKFDQKMKRLEELVLMMEKNEMDLEKTLEYYQEGQKLILELSKALEEFQAKIPGESKDE